MNKRTTRSILLASVMGMTLALSACGSDEPSTSSSAGDEAATTEEATTEETTEEAPAEEGPFGAACAGVPTEGEGSVEGMADDPVATAASNNPLLSTLVAAVTAANLGDTLNGAPELTVFAPSNDAFAAVDPAALASLLEPANVDQLTAILTYHVIGERIAPEDLAGTFPTLNGAEVTIEGSGEEFTTNVGGTPTASVVCGNVQTANATVYIIDQVMMPPAA
ncbi:MAG: fasciclin domain-containing protein [Actinomycetota bacterium]|nr:fasciclin domain-containing protein [Actinomycetota bacterium]